ncbi:hypothetical protein [Galbibacter sp.]
MTNSIPLLKSRLTLYFSIFFILVFTSRDNGVDNNTETVNTAGDIQ